MQARMSPLPGLPPGISDIDELVAAFSAGEDANLTLFNYVTEVTRAVTPRAAAAPSDAQALITCGAWL